MEDIDYEYGRDLILNHSIKYLQDQNDKDTHHILDIGCYLGKDLSLIKNECQKLNLNVKLHGLDYFNNRKDDLANCEENLRKNEIDYHIVNIEREHYPFKDNMFDIVISDNTLEHIRELYWIIGEASRVLKPNGLLLISVPNLANWLGRINLLFGRQPPAIDILGYHLRGYTKKGFKKFFESGDYFKMERFYGRWFKPLIKNAKLNFFLSKIFPTFCNEIIFIIRRTEKNGNFIEVLEKNQIRSFNGWTPDPIMPTDV